MENTELRPGRTRMTTALGIICKAPELGRTKTRLAASIGARAAADLSACFLRDIAATINSIPESVCWRGYAVYAPANGARAPVPSPILLLCLSRCELRGSLRVIINRQDLTRDRFSSVRRKKQDQRSDVFRVNETLQGLEAHRL